MFLTVFQIYKHQTMSVFSVIVFQMMAAQFVSSQFGGPSTFGYDASSACSKPYSRNARAYLEKIPCDFQRQNWCTVAGNFYPWHAVKRFVKENQGLMRRMYGDEKHISVIKSELEKNDLEVEFDDRYSRAYNEYKSFLYEDEFELEDEEQEYPRESQGRRLNEKNAEVISDDFSRSRPNEVTTLSTSSTRETISSTEIPSTTSHNISTRLSMSTTLTKATSTSFSTVEDQPMEKMPTILSEIARIKNSSFNEIPGFLETIKDINVSSTPGKLEILDKVTVDPVEFSKASTTLPFDGTTEGFDKGDQIAASTNEEQKFRPRPQYRPSETKEPSKIESQLFQEAAAKDKIDLPVLKLRGVNACPVKEEVVAPFWANNTRGEVLALLNLYPFEQYVHWEKCTHPKKQMYCREGCRCEQQFRLHRLLAYDPNNECRGIFSDWFKFPSCCVCRCYDLPLEFRVTSRSPRTLRQKLKLRSRNRWT